MKSLIAENISVIRDDRTLVDQASLIIKQGELVVLLGPNGAGKSMLIRSLLGLVPSQGRSVLGDDDLTTLGPEERAKLAAYLPQKQEVVWPNYVYDIVSLGRFAHGAAPGRLGPADRDAINDAIKTCALEDLTNRRMDTLSGGESARVHIARALATKAPFLLADEPVAALDPYHQLRVMDVIRTFVNNGGGALVVLHDIALAAAYADRLIWMKDSAIVKQGTVGSTLTKERLADIYGVAAHVDGTAVTITGTAET